MMNDDEMERLRADLIRRAERIRESKLDESGDEEPVTRAKSQPSTPTATVRQHPRQSSAPSFIIPSERRSKIQTINGQPDLSDFGKALGWLHESPWVPPADSTPLFSQYVLPISPPKAAFLSDGCVHPALERSPMSRAPRNAMEASHLRNIYVESLPSSSSIRPSTSSSTSFCHEKLSRKWTRTSEGGLKPQARNRAGYFPWSSPDTRAYSIQCLASGIFLAADLSVYLGLALHKDIRGSQLGITLIILAIFGSVLFFYGVMRLLILYARKSRDGERFEREEGGGCRLI